MFSSVVKTNKIEDLVKFGRCKKISGVFNEDFRKCSDKFATHQFLNIVVSLLNEKRAGVRRYLISNDSGHKQLPKLMVPFGANFRSLITSLWSINSNINSPEKRQIKICSILIS